MNRILLAILFISVSCLTLLGQSHIVDSLQNDLKNEKDDTNKVNKLLYLSKILESKGQYKEACSLSETTLLLAQKINFTKGIASAYHILGTANYFQSNIPIAVENFFKAIKIFEKIGDTEGLATSYNFLGETYEIIKEDSTALSVEKKALQLADKIDYAYITASAENDIGRLYGKLGDTANALKMQLNAIKTFLAIKDTINISFMYRDIGTLYKTEKNYNQAYEYYLKALKHGGDLLKPSTYNELGDLFWRQKQYTSALEYEDTSLMFGRKIDSKDDIREASKTLSLIYEEKGNPIKALEFYKLYNTLEDSIYGPISMARLNKTALNYALLSEKTEEDRKEAVAEADKRKQVIVIWSVSGGLLLVLVFAGFVFRSLRMTRKQKKEIEEQKNIVESKQEVIDEKNRSLGILNSIGKEITSTLDLDKVMRMVYTNISKLMDVSFFIISAYNEESQSVSVKFCVKEGVIVSEQFTTPITNSNSFTALTIKNKSEIIIHDLEKEYSNYLSGKPQLHGKEDLWCESMIFIPLLVQNKLIGLFSVQSVAKNTYSESNIDMLRSLASFIAVSLNNAESYNQVNSANQEISNQKHLVEEKNKDILDSITYAKRLQDAILPPLSIIKQYLPESFLLYKPKDIVAGDFYWMERIEDTILIAAADCTGHGVPGALVSVVCSNALNRTVKEFHIIESGKILDKVRELVLETFEKSDGNIQDGMDISLCCINTKANEIQWSGAYNPLWYFHGGQILEVDADKQPIGKHDKPLPFNTHNLKLQKGDTLYLFTDGYADQFGGPKGKKFKYKQLQELLLANAAKSMEEQKNALESMLNEWKGSLEQVDDILLIGIRV